MVKSRPNIKLSLSVIIFCSIIFTFAHPTSNKSQSIKQKKRTFEGNLLGLSPMNLQRNGISIGFLPAFGERISPNDPKSINARLPVPMAIMGDYVDLASWDDQLTRIDFHMGWFSSIEGNPVWELALMPNEGLEMVTQDIADKIGKKMRWINEQGIIVWLRFAHEMNGDWYKWGQQPELFLEKWKLVFEAVKAQTDNTYMLWAPNSRFAEVNEPHGGYNLYWPGPQYVDIVGLSFYHYGGHGRTNVLPPTQHAISVLKNFSDLFSTPFNIPVVLAETAASYTRSIESGQPAWGGASEYDIKYQWIQQLLSKEMTEAVPNLRAIAWLQVSMI
ncbi:hypothetical protein CROQUDRAFT_673444 [Cronartium quercuum f. sp. fusiforme G11]|uniref:GH26 domain-containing protein n=1 Tax=Cronartium quercuum f. sp. fusiforme G11 TaxID=708437 RepID=A0A9P6T8J0_9BASI|nr:hypothetical protein CROQUDRAFT_673444 [Cronartium quercuum f. sp. fusiforme G11]